MPKDHRRYKKSRPARPSGGSFSWTLFGIVIGVFIVGFFYWKQVAAPKHHAGKIGTSAQHAAVAQKPEKPAATTPEFDFYTVLPTATPANPAAAKNAATRAPVALTVPPTAEAKPTTPTVAKPAPQATVSPNVAATTALENPLAATAHPSATSSKTPANAATKAPAKTAETYFLQMGVLKSYADADRLKAELTMLGYDVFIQPYTDKGQVYNRVMMGPYASKATALQQKEVLQKNHVASVVIK